MSEGWVRARAALRPWDVSLEWRSGAAYAVKPERRGTRGPGLWGDLSGQQRELQTVGSPWGSTDLDVPLLQQGQARDSTRSQGSELEFSCGHGRSAAWGPGRELQGGLEGPGCQPQVGPLVGTGPLVPPGDTGHTACPLSHPAERQPGTYLSSSFATRIN